MYQNVIAETQYFQTGLYRIGEVDEACKRERDGVAASPPLELVKQVSI